MRARQWRPAETEFTSLWFIVNKSHAAQKLAFRSRRAFFSNDALVFAKPNRKTRSTDRSVGFLFGALGAFDLRHSLLVRSLFVRKDIC